MSTTPINTDSTCLQSIRFLLSSQIRVQRRRALPLPEPNPNVPVPMKLDINPNDGYTLEDYGDLLSYDDPFLPAPPSQIEIPNNYERKCLRARRPLPPRLCATGKKITLGIISPTCSGFRFPDLPSTPKSPESTKREFQSLVECLKERDLSKEHSGASTPEESQSPVAATRLSISIVAPKLSPAPKRKAFNTKRDVQKKISTKSKKRFPELPLAASFTLPSSFASPKTASLLSASFPLLSARKIYGRPSVNIREKGRIILRTRGVSHKQDHFSITSTQISVTAF